MNILIICLIAYYNISLFIVGLIHVGWVLVISIGIIIALFIIIHHVEAYHFEKQIKELINNAEEIKISKNIQSQNINLDDVKRSLKNLTTPEKKHPDLVCPDCGETPLWIRSEDSIISNINNEYGTDCSIYFDYAICSKCLQVIHSQFIKYRAWPGG